MGSCFSKKRCSASSPSSPPPCLNKPSNQIQMAHLVEADPDKAKKQQLGPPDGEDGKQGRPKKEVFVIKHRKSHDGNGVCAAAAAPAVNTTPISPNSEGKDKDCVSGSGDSSGEVNDLKGVVSAAAAVTVDANPFSAVRSSSCSKEEVDAILIQCGRLSRSSSGKASGRKYSGSKRSFDFDTQPPNGGVDDEVNKDEKDDCEKRKSRRERGSRSRSTSHGRRRTPSREREGQQQQQRSGSSSRDRRMGSSNNSGSGRRVSLSPGRRSENNATTDSANASSYDKSAAAALQSGNGSSIRPGKMVSVPASVASLGGCDGSNGNPGGGGGIRRVLVRRNAGASPRSRSPANRNVDNNGNAGQQPMPSSSLSRSSSRKAEHSPYRRHPLAEIDNNATTLQNLPHSTTTTTKTAQNTKTTRHAKLLNNSSKESGGKSRKEGALEKTSDVEQHSGRSATTADPKGVDLNKTSSNNSDLGVLSRSRSSRRSRDFDFNPDLLLPNPTTSYNALLLEDIHNFHHTTTTTSPSIPPCLTKACSILEAVADLNSSCSAPNLSSSPHHHGGPVLEPAVAAGDDDLMKPSFHKYVTVQRGTVSGEEMEEQEESSGSNSFVSGSQQRHYWASSSSSSTSLREPNSAESTDRWTDSRLEKSSSDVERRRLGVSKRRDTTGYQQQQSSKAGRGSASGIGIGTR